MSQANAVAYSSTSTPDEARQLLASVNAEDWLVFTTAAGTFVELKTGISVGEFAKVLGVFDNNWVLTKDPRA
jgi:hypothetical protein